jgi:hypothetical protein
MHLTLADKTEIKNLSCTAPNLVISQSSSSRIQIYVRKFKHAIYDKHKQLCGYTETEALLCLLINHIIILAPPLP